MSKRTINIALVTERDSNYRLQAWLATTLWLSGRYFDVTLVPQWLDNSKLSEIAEHEFSNFSGVWINATFEPSQPVAMKLISLVKHSNVPLLATGEGFFYVLLDHLRSVKSGEKSDDIDLAIALKSINDGDQLASKSRRVYLLKESRIASVYRNYRVSESGHSRYVMNMVYEYLFLNGEMQITGRDGRGDAQAVESTSHPFYIATLYSPEKSIEHGYVHPLVAGFIEACILYSGQRNISASVRYGAAF